MTQRLHQSDQELRHTIIEELQYDPSVEASQISVTVGDGMVKLSGEVLSLAGKMAANRSALQVRGVRAVADEITVRVPPGADVDLADSARNMLKWAVNVPKDSVKADVKNHVITLSGSVSWQYQRIAASRAVTNMRGITAVNNQISLDRPTSTLPVPSAVTAAFRRSAMLDSRNIVVDIDGHELVLRGTVRSFAELHQAERIAWTAAGVSCVHNELAVTS